MITLTTASVLHVTIFLLLGECALPFRPRPRHLLSFQFQFKFHHARRHSNRSNHDMVKSSTIEYTEKRVYDTLTKAFEGHVEDGSANENDLIFDMIDKSYGTVHRLGSEALLHTEHGVVDNISSRQCLNDDLSSRLRHLSTQSVLTCRQLTSLIHQMNSSKSRSKKTSGNAWRNLQSIVSRSIDMKNRDMESAAAALAILSLGIAICTDADVDKAKQKMIASAILPNSLSRIFKSKACNDFSMSSKQERVVKGVARNSLLYLLRTAVEEKDSIDILARIETAYGIGCEKDEEVCSAVGSVVKEVFGSCCYHSYQSNEGENDFGRTELIIDKEKASPTLALVAQCKPWKFIKTDELVRIAAADLDLWYSAELVCDASVASTSTKQHTADSGNWMAASYPKFESTDSISTQTIDSSLRQDTIAHLTTRALIDAALDLRLYRRADLFASKYYAISGAERFAEARFLHACETITKVVKRKQPQIIEKQVLRIDECIARVSQDLNLSVGGEQKMGIGEVPIETMPRYIREFALRRLRLSNMSTAAVRLADLWGMKYEEDPNVLAEEEKKRKLTYVQWHDEGSPGNFAGNSQPLPDLISSISDLNDQFKLLLLSGDTIGFDAEWGEDDGVAVLQLSTVSHSILLDIPALSSGDEGCKALQATVGKLFSGLTGAKYVIGFGCKEDIKRLRDSPCSRSVHWFPHNNCAARDLRPLIIDLGLKGAQHLGLSRATETFLGKQLDKAEQCSDWAARPLTSEQREYAALDAWACAAIHAKIINERYNS